jgi:hypothetical protein
VHLLISADAKNVAYFNHSHNGLRNNPRLEVREIQKRVDAGVSSSPALAFLNQDGYHLHAFELMQKQWSEEIAKILDVHSRRLPRYAFLSYSTKDQ